MAKKVLGIIIVLFVAFSGNAQRNGNIYRLGIYKISNVNGIEKSIYVAVDSLGNISVDNKPTGERIDLKSFSKSVKEFVKKEKPEKMPAGNYPPEQVEFPKKNQQISYIHIIFMQDYIDMTDKDVNPITYKLEIRDLDHDLNNYSLYNYLKGSNLSMIKEKLK